MSQPRARHWLSWLGIVGLVVLALGIAARSDHAPGDAARVEGIAAGLRCPVCQGLSVADSDAETARQIRSDINRRVAARQTDAEIRQAYVDRYGQWILLRPSSRGLGALVWLLPAVVVGAAALGLVVVYRRRRQAWPRAATEADREIVEQARRQQLVGETDP
ncbi:MAG: cytochrome c-type biogenesis protein [Acidimicrobiales bacterium]